MENITHNQPKNGFTLLEMVIVILISGIIMTTSAGYFSQYLEKQRFDITHENVKYAAAILSTYSTDIYPCPSDRSLGVGDPNYGQPVGFDNATGPATGCKAAFDALPMNGCSSTGGYCKIRAINVDKNDDNIDDYIYVGGYPLRFIELNNPNEAFDDAKTLDGYGNQLTYAVSQNMTRYHNGATPDDQSADSPQETWGVITIEDEFGNPTGGIEGDAFYTITSHGKDGAGAFSASGQPVAPCSTSSKSTTFVNLLGLTETVVRQDDNGAAVDADNCDEDDIFRQALGNYDANSPAHFDDAIEYNVSSSILLWQHTVDSTGKITENMRNLNSGSIGIDEIEPDHDNYKLDVNGTLRAESYARAKQLCDTTGACKDINNIVGSTGISCPSGKAVTKIINGEISSYCENVGVSPNTHTCNPGKFITSFNADGSVSCN